MSGIPGNGHGSKTKKKTIAIVSDDMNKEIIDTLGGSIFIIMGLVFIVFHTKLAHKTSNFYYKLLHIQSGEKGYRIGFFVVGISFIIVGLLSIFKIIRFR